MKTSYIKRIVIIVIAVFVAVNVFWLIDVFKPYFSYVQTMKESEYYRVEDGGVWYPDGYLCEVAMPTYLYWKDGNLSVASPIEGEYSGHADLVIWIKHYSGDVSEVGSILTYKGESREVYLKDSATAINSDDQPWVDANQEDLEMVFLKAEDVWGLEL
ncbi:MAG: hypothetical protein K6G01_01940 [Eubacterium sp.]|nr:hypothetical protein [Eubacterium sp.]